MSTYTSEPGTRLGGRYRLEDRVAAAVGWAAWKAIDETLARPVTVLTFAPAFPRLREVVTAARAASRLSDPRFAQVFDVEDDWDHAYIVMEWSSGESLDDLIASGPLEADRGARIVAEAAEAISAAHAAGLAHLCLLPNALRWTPGGGVKITGLGINAALSGATAENPALADTRGLGMLLYAALTGFWPGPDCPTLPPAPTVAGLLRSPRQVRAGVPSALDEITSRTLQLREQDGGPVFTTPAELAASLAAALPPAPIPQPPPRPRADPRRRSAPERGYRSGDGHADRGYDSGYQPTGDEPGGGYLSSFRDGPQRSGVSPRARGIAAALLAVVLVAGLTFAVLHFADSGGSGHAPAAVNHPSNATHAAGATVLTPVSDEGLDESDTNAANAIDGNSSTPWTTHFYDNNPVFGGLQQGSGLLLNMGQTVKLSSVTVTFGSIPGANVEIKIGSPGAEPGASNNPPPAQQNADQAFANAMTVVAQQDNVSGTVTFPVTSTASGQYVLIWFTKLPLMAGSTNKYQAQIFNVVVKGSAG
jgi:serine/threonine protein kinase